MLLLYLLRFSDQVTRKVTDIDVVILELLMFTEQDAGGARGAVWCGWPGGAGHDWNKEKEVQQQQPLWAQCSAWHDTVSIQSPKSLFEPVKYNFSKIMKNCTSVTFSSVSFVLAIPLLSVSPKRLVKVIFFPGSITVPPPSWPSRTAMCWTRLRTHSSMSTWSTMSGLRRSVEVRSWCSLSDIVKPLMWWCWFVLSLYLSFHYTPLSRKTQMHMHCC